MAYRFTNTDKWNDTWFCGLNLCQKAVFLYLCDQCDMAGFYEINLHKMAWNIAVDCADVEEALKGLKSRIIYSSNGKFIFLKNFVKNQKNLPLNEKNPAHRGIIKLLNEKMYLFNFQSINDFFSRGIEGASKGHQSPTGNIYSNISNKDNNSNINNIRGIEGASKGLRFLIPSIDEIKQYCIHRKNNVDPHKFFDFYESKGWLIGKNKMKDWKAAVRTWENNQNTLKTTNPQPQPTQLNTNTFNEPARPKIII